MARLSRFDVVAAVGSAVGGVLAVAGWIDGGALAVLVGAAVGLIAIDNRERRLPTRLVAIGAAGTLLVGLGAALDDRSLLGGAVGTSVVLVVFLGIHLASPSALGFGDVRLATVLGGLTGLATESIAGPVAMVILASIAASATMVLRRRSTAAFGPYLVVASGLVILLSIAQ